MSAKKNVKKIVEFLAIKSAKMACGTASTNDFCQTKEPENLKKYFSKRYLIKRLLRCTELL